MGVEIVLCFLTAAAGPESSDADWLLYRRIDFSRLDDRIYLQGAYYPPEPDAASTAEGLARAGRPVWGSGDWLQTLPNWMGGLVQVPVVPGYAHRLRVRLMPHAACLFSFYVVEPGRSKMAIDTEGHPVKTVELDANQDATVEIDLSPDVIGGRERIGLFYRPMAIDDPQRRAEVGFRTWWIEALVQDAPGAARAMEVYRAIEEKRIRKERFTLTADSFVKPGEPFQLSLVARTPAGYPDVAYEGTVELLSNSADLDLPSSVTFSAEDKGVKRIEGLVCRREGEYVIRAFDPGRIDEVWRSNYVICEANPRYRLYWGDLHVHTDLSDGYRDLDYAYGFARDVSKLDFIAINDHETWLNKTAWAHAQEKAAEYHEPGRFVPFLGLEWTSTVRGHHNVWFPGDRAPDALTHREDYFSQPVSEVGRFVAEYGGLISSHHLHPVADFSDWRADYEPVIEIYSLWGSSERTGDPVQTSIQEWVSYAGEENVTAIGLLDRGVKVGFIGGSDTHVTAPGANVSQSYWAGVCPYRRPGVAAVYAEALTRESIMEALRNRRCYGTMNERIIVDFSANGHTMGQEFDLEGDEVRFRMRAWGTGPITSAQLIRNGTVLYAPIGWGEADRIDHTFIDRPPAGTSYYYLRVQQSIHGEYVNAWSSPIWVRKGHDTPPAPAE